MSNNGKTLKAVVVEHGNGVFTAFVEQFPGVLIQCDKREDISKHLDIAMESFVARLTGKKTYTFEEQTI